MSPSTPRQARMTKYNLKSTSNTRDNASKKPNSNMPLSKILWTKDAEASLIQKVKRCQSLWDCRHPNYLKKTLRREQYESIATHMMDKHPHLGYLCSDHVRIKFSNMKTYYLREKKRMQATESTSLVSPKWEWFEMLSFIDDCSEPLPSEPSLLHNQDIIDEAISIKEECVSPDLVIENGLSNTDIHNNNNNNNSGPWTPGTNNNNNANTQQQFLNPLANTTSKTHQQLQPLNPLTSALHRHNLLNTSTEDISSNEDEPPIKKRRVLRKKNSTSDLTTVAVQKLIHTMEQEQDYAYGIGVAVASCVRKFPFRKQLQISCKILNILNEECAD